MVTLEDRSSREVRTPKTGRADRQRPQWLRLLPLAIVLAGLAIGYALGFQHDLSLAALADRRHALQAYVQAHVVAAAAFYFVVYVLAVAFSFPAASVLTIIGGFLFGWLEGGALTVAAATLGATTIFLVAKTALGDSLRRRAGPTLERLAGGFEHDAFNYLLALRLAPVFPFFIVNVAPAFFRVKLRDYVTATAIGILPGTFVYAYLGEGLDSVVAAAEKAGRGVSLSDVATWQITLAFVLLALLAVVPPVVARMKRH